MQRAIVLSLVLASFGAVAILVPGIGVAGSAKHPPLICGTPAHSRELVEPPNVDVSQLPVNASGEHELILAVHADGAGSAQRYCYRYEWNGSAQTVAPTIRTMRGEQFAIRIVNDLAGPSRGERVSSAEIPPCTPMHMPNMARTAHYAGYLNHTIDDRWMRPSMLDTNIHLHGFEGPAADENIFLSTLSTPMHACEYHVTIPRTQPPGTYLYHPHAHGSSGGQVASGLDGVWIVEPDRPQIPRSSEHVVMLRYRIPQIALNSFAPDETPLYVQSIAREATLPLGSPVPYDPFNPPPWPVTIPMKIGSVALDTTGCSGQLSEVRLALNGSDIPATLQIPARETQLIRIANGTSDSATRLLMHDASGRLVPFHVVGLDGVPVSGDMERPLARYLTMNELMLTSMSRADVVVAVDPGDTYVLSSEHYCSGADGFFEQHQDLLRVSATSPPASAPSTEVSSMPAVIADTPAARLVAYARASPAKVRRRAFTFTQYIIPPKGKTPPHARYFITETSNSNFHEHPFWPAYASNANFPSNADVVVKQGTVEEWYLVNTTMEAHAFHIHQMSIVQEKGWAGMPITTDTVFIPVGSLMPNTREPNYPLVKPRITKILLDFRHVPRGTFVFHCHMLFHEDHGMMAIIRVV